MPCKGGLTKHHLILPLAGFDPGKQIWARPWIDIPKEALPYILTAVLFVEVEK